MRAATRYTVALTPHARNAQEKGRQVALPPSTCSSNAGRLLEGVGRTQREEPADRTRGVQRVVVDRTVGQRIERRDTIEEIINRERQVEVLHRRKAAR